MARRFHRKERLSALSELNVTPLIDLAFSLLIIFMIAAPLLEQTISLELPKESQSRQQVEQEVYQTISINKEGRIAWGDDWIDMDELDRLLAGIALLENPPILHVRADAHLPYQNVVTVLDKIKRHDLTKISLDTEVL